MNGKQQPPYRGTPQGTRPTQNGAPAKRRRKFRFKPNKEGMQALVLLLLIAALIITILVLTIKGIVNAVSGPDETTESTTTQDANTQDSTTEAPVVITWHDGYVNDVRPNADVAIGDLILVNFEYSYPLTDAIKSKLKHLYSDSAYGEYFVLSGSDMTIRSEILPYLRQMLTDLVNENTTLGTTKTEDRVIIVSGHRTTDYQQGLYDKQIEDNYVAVPGHSEHHTGLAVDLKVFTSASRTVEFREDEQAWMEANCADYGFIVRYDGAKFELTGILDETWHFRYVGKPHAQYMAESGLCLEEYLSMLRTSYSVDSDTPLSYTVDETEYQIYYVPASAGETTDIPVPKRDTVKSIDISGDNIGGFIVTVARDASASSSDPTTTTTVPAAPVQTGA